MMKFREYLEGVSTVGIAGHMRPDGDCVGSCLGTYNYITENYPDIKVDLYLEQIQEKFRFLPNADKIQTVYDESPVKEHDLFIVLDCADSGRLNKADRHFKAAKKTLCIDHHVTNGNFADYNYTFADASSASELAYTLMEEDKVSKAVAECIYTGIVHDTGVFQYSCTGQRTMEIAGKLMSMGIDYPDIVDSTFFIKSFEELKINGYAFSKAQLCLDGKCIYSVISREEMEQFGVTAKQLDGIVSTLRSVKGVDTSIFIYQTDTDGYKVSLRSAKIVDVAAIAAEFGGGGHVRAAGMSIFAKSPEAILEKLIDMIGRTLCTAES